MTLGELIRRLEQERASQVVAHGFDRPHSYRGFYDQLAFEPAEDVTVGAMWASAVAAVGTTYEGWKGGQYRMEESTPVWLAKMGECGEEIGVRLLEFMLAGAEVRSSRSSPDLAPWYEADGSTVMLPAEEVTRRRKLAAKVIAAARSVVTDHAQDAIEDPVGHHDRYGSGFARVSFIAIDDLSDALDALAAASPSPAEDHAGDPRLRCVACGCEVGAPDPGVYCVDCTPTVRESLARAREEGRREGIEEAARHIEAACPGTDYDPGETIETCYARAVRSLASRVIPGGA